MTEVERGWRRDVGFRVYSPGRTGRKMRAAFTEGAGSSEAVCRGGVVTSERAIPTAERIAFLREMITVRGEKYWGEAFADASVLFAALDEAQTERDEARDELNQTVRLLSQLHAQHESEIRRADRAQARIAAVESDRQRDAYEAGERLYAAERRAEQAEARIVELEAERVHVLKQSNALSVASKGLRTWVVKFQGQIRADIAEDVAQMTADIGEAERLVEQAETELGHANVAEDPGEAVFSHEIPPIAPGRRPAPQLNPNWPYEDRSVKVCRGCGRQTLTFHAEGCEVASYEVVLDADCAPVATPEETE